MGEKQDALKKTLVSGGVTVVFELCMGHALEHLKIRKQVAPRGTTYKQILADIVGTRGFVGILDGFLPFGLIQASVKGAVFGGAEVVAHKLIDKTPLHGTQAGDVLAGGVAGFAQGLFLSPLLLLKTRVMTDPVFRESLGMPMMKVLGITTRLGMRVAMEREIFKGALAFASKRFADWTTRYFFANLTEKVLFQDGAKSFEQQIVGGLIGGCLSTLVTIPLDVIVAQMQQKDSAGRKMTIRETFIANLKGGQMLSGLVPRLVHVALTTAMLRTATNFVYQALEKN